MVGSVLVESTVFRPDPMSLEPPSPTSIRFANRADALAIAEMSRDLIERGLGWSWTKERVTRCLRHPDSNVVVAIRNADRAGFGIMKYGEDEAHLLLLAVRPGHARCGVGRTIVDWLEAYLRRSDRRGYVMDPAEDSDLNALARFLRVNGIAVSVAA